jgi:ubiquinone/menaquinone biosynthesis C-methylase UbiE
MGDDAASFIGNIPQYYDQGLGPIIFAEYAVDIARRAAGGRPARVLETAAGTGIVTRELRDALPDGAQLTATDLNPPMLDIAHAKFGPGEQVEFQPADATALSFADQSFDAIVCQFGLMFYPDKAKSFSEAYRVLLPAAVTCSASGIHIAIIRSAASRMMSRGASFRPIRRSFTACRSPATRSIRSRSG